MQVVQPYSVRNILAGLFVLVVLGGCVFLLISPTLRNAMYRPRAEHRKAAMAILGDILGDDAAKIAVVAVDNDVNLIYVTATLGEKAIGNIKNQGRRVAKMPGEVYEFDKERIVMIDLKSTPSKIMVGTWQGRENAPQCLDRYRQWLEGAQPPSP